MKMNRSVQRSTVGEIPEASTYGGEENEAKPQHGESGGLVEGFPCLGTDIELELGSHF